MKYIFSIASLVICLGLISLLAKKQTVAIVKVPSATTGESKPVKTTDLPKQIQQDLNSAAQEAAKRLEQVDSKP
jgi:hypothetical protein